MLQSGVHINIINENVNDTHRIMINSGTKKAQHHENYGYAQAFFDYAFIPQVDWRPLTKSEMAIVLSNNLVDRRVVQVVRMPDAVMNCFKYLRERIAQMNAWRVQQMIQELNVSLQPQTHLWEYIRSIHHGTTNSIMVRGIGVSDPGKITVTHDNVTGQYVGLHFDSFAGDDIINRECSPNRLCINIGMEVRYLMFINLTAPQIYTLLNVHHIRDVNTLLQTFLKQYPQYPVLKLAIHPGEAYIAPTEAIIHDGTTLDKVQVDVNFTVLGQFSARTFV
jgi:hypothetical protein